MCFSFPIPAVRHDVDVLSKQQRILPQNQIQLGCRQPSCVVVGTLPLHQQRLISHNLLKNFLGSTGEMSHSKASIPSSSVSAPAANLRQPGIVFRGAAGEDLSAEASGVGEEGGFFKMLFGDVEVASCCCCCCIDPLPISFASIFILSFSFFFFFFFCPFAASTMVSIFSEVIMIRLC